MTVRRLAAPAAIVDRGLVVGLRPHATTTRQGWRVGGTGRATRPGRSSCRRCSASDAKQVREICMNPAARDATAAKRVRQRHDLRDGELRRARARRRHAWRSAPTAKWSGDLIRVFVMGKNAGWGAECSSRCGGSWVYAAWLPSGQKAPGRHQHLPRLPFTVGQQDLYLATTSTSPASPSSPRRRTAEAGRARRLWNARCAGGRGVGACTATHAPWYLGSQRNTTQRALQEW